MRRCDGPAAMVDTSAAVVGFNLHFNTLAKALDAKTRVMLDLPPRANSPNNGKNRAARG